ncbi:MAG TPA: hypothetical protein VGV39_00165 [Mesorhizobium sp.]|jgi:hypothetical protein|uniref:hypothetical protein n=1 Tax=Mesorhizobium sp. TaxID=1871066 RepID=UPI002DDD7D70|nr:hypothetical protein [Mesorhizobium sp.]HEV2501454.1 hypothetical protein [Mesorhizobium sp.]
MNLKQQLVVVGDVYAGAVGLSRARISTIVLNRGATLSAIAEGRADVTTSTFEAAMQWFSNNWPAPLPWPEAIIRPEPQRPATFDPDHIAALRFPAQEAAE